MIRVKIMKNLLRINFVITTFNSFGQCEENFFKASFISTFFNHEISTESVYGKSAVESFSIFIGDSSNVIVGEYGERLPKKSIPIVFKIKNNKIPKTSLVYEKKYFLYVNKYKYDALTDSIESRLLTIKMDYVDSLIWKDIEMSSKDSSNLISLLSFKKGNRKIYYLISRKKTGMIKASIKRKDRKFLKSKGYSVNDIVEKYSQSFLNVFILFCEEKRTEFRIFELE